MKQCWEEQTETPSFHSGNTIVWVEFDFLCVHQNRQIAMHYMQYISPYLYRSRWFDLNILLTEFHLFSVKRGMMQSGRGYKIGIVTCRWIAIRIQGSSAVRMFARNPSHHSRYGNRSHVFNFESIIECCSRVNRVEYVGHFEKPIEWNASRRLFPLRIKSTTNIPFCRNAWNSKE